jgi:hypothetical protein
VFTHLLRVFYLEALTLCQHETSDASAGTIDTDSSLHEGGYRMAQSQTASDTSAPKPKRRKRRLLKILIALFVLLIIGVAFLPALIGGPFKGIVVSQINNQLNGKLTIDTMSLSWFGGQQVSGVKLTDDAGEPMLDVDKIDLPAVSLWGLAMGNRDFGDVTIHIKDVHVVQLADGTNNLQRVAKTSETQSNTTPTNATDTTSTSGSADENVERPSKGVLKVSDMIPDGMAADVHLLMHSFTFDAPDTPTTTLADTSMDVHVKAGLPVTGKLASTMTHGPLRGTVASNLNIDQMADLSDTQITLDVTPAAWAQFATNSQAQLLEPFGMSLKISKLKLPALSGAAGLGDMAADIALTMTDIKLQPQEQALGTLALTGARLQIDADGKDKPVIIAMQGKVTQSNQPGAFDLNIKLDHMLSELAQTKPDFSQVKTSIVGDVQNVGLVIFDELLQTHGMIRNAIGPTLTASINSQLQYDSTGVPQGNLNLKAVAQFLNADVSVNIGSDGISQATPGKLVMQITPALYASAMQLKAEQHNPLAQSFNATLLLNQIIVPRVNNQWQIHTASLDMALTMDDILLKGQGANAQNVVLTQPSWQIKCQSLGKEIKLAGGFDASQQGGNPGKFTMNVSANDLFDAEGLLRREKATFKANLTLLPWQLPQLIPGMKFNLNKLVNQIIGSRQSIELTGQMMPASHGATEPSVPNMALQFKTSSFAINSDISAMIKDDLITVDPASKLNIKLTPELVALFMQPTPVADKPADAATPPPATTTPPVETTPVATPMGLAKPVTLNGQVTALTWPLREDQQSKAIVGVNLTADRVEPTGLPGNLSASLRNMKLSIGRGNPAVKLPVLLTGDLYESESLAGKLQVDVALLNLLATPTAQDLHVSMQDVPVALLDSLAGMKGKVYALLGTRIKTVDLTTQGPLDKDMQVTMLANSDMMDVSIKANVTPDVVSVQSGSYANLKVTPASLGAVMVAMNPDLLKNPPKWLLVSPATFKFAVDKAVYYTAADKLPETQVGLTFSSTDLGFIQRETKTPLTLSALNVKLDAPKLSSPITANLTANMVAKDEQGKSYQTPFVSNTTITNLMDKLGKVDAVHATIKTNTNIPQLPIELIDELAQQDGKLAGIIGPTADIKMVGSYPGDMEISLNGKFTTVVIPAKIDANRILTLSKDAVVTLAVTPETAQTLLKYGNPILIDATSSRDPIKATVYAKDFAMPLADFDIKKLSADMDVELGTITLQNSWLLNSISEGLGKLDKMLNVSSKQEAKFTKLSVSMRDGVTKTNDMWLQINDVQLFGKSRIDTLTLGTQGSVDLANSTVNMGLALPAQTFYSFGNSLRKYISADTIFEMPLNGPLDKVALKGLDKLAIQIGAMVAGGELAGDKLGGWGALLGQVAGSALGGGDVKQFQTKRTWPNKPVIKDPAPVAEEPTKQQKTTQQQTQQLNETKPKEKSDKEKLRDALRGLFQ